MKRIATAAILLVVALFAQKERAVVSEEIETHVLRPAKIEATDARIAKLQLPPGFQIRKFASNLGNPRIIAVASDGTVYVTRRQTGDCLMLRNGKQQVVARQPQLHGIVLHGNSVYLATVKEVFVADRKADGTLGELKKIADNLPDGGQHPNRTLFVGPDEKLYITVGSTCNACAETSPESATVLRTDLNGGSRSIFASGLRNTIGMAWHPQTRQLFGMDHGIDWLGDNEQDEELNELVNGSQYGWPYVYANGKPNPADEPPGGKSYADWAQASRAPVLLYTAHAAPMQMIFYTGSQFPAEYRNDVFVTMRGSWNRKPPSGYEVVRVRFQNGRPVSFEPFLRGFLTKNGRGWAHFGRPVGLVQMPDGSLLVGDDSNGVIYQITYGGSRVSGLQQTP